MVQIVNFDIDMIYYVSVILIQYQVGKMNTMNSITLEYNFTDFNDGNHACCSEVHVTYHFLALCTLHVFTS